MHLLLWVLWHMKLSDKELAKVSSRLNKLPIGINYR